MPPLVLARTLHLCTPLMHGADVLAVQTLLNAKGFKCVTDGIFGPEAAGRCVEAKKAFKYAKAKQTPTCGQALVDHLEAHKAFPPPPQTALRDKYVAAMRDAIASHGRWNYAQSRPIPHPPQLGTIETDCSGSLTYLAQLIGAPDPNGKIGGVEYSGLGYTGTMLDHCTRVTRPMLLPGDLVVFGMFPGHHVVGVMELGMDPLCFSHGKQGDPREVRLSIEVAAQPPGIAYLRFLP